MSEERVEKCLQTNGQCDGMAAASSHREYLWIKRLVRTDGCFTNWSYEIDFLLSTRDPEWAAVRGRSDLRHQGVQTDSRFRMGEKGSNLECSTVALVQSVYLCNV